MTGGDLWQHWHNARIRQTVLGKCSAFFLVLAVLSLTDGLQGLVRSGSESVELLAGQTTAVSGPCPFKNPVSSDLQVSFFPSNAPLDFELEGFFPGYLLGNGMWRGVIRAHNEAGTGIWQMRVAFGSSVAGATTKYEVKVFANMLEQQQTSPYLLFRYFGLSAWLFFAFFGVLGIITGIVTYGFGRVAFKTLQQLGFAEVFRIDSNVTPQLIWCVTAQVKEENKNIILDVINANGQFLGQACIQEIKNSVVCLQMLAGQRIEIGSLVAVGAIMSEQK